MNLWVNLLNMVFDFEIISIFRNQKVKIGLLCQKIIFQIIKMKF